MANELQIPLQEQGTDGVWNGYGFLRQLIQSTRKTVKVDVYYAPQAEDGTIGTLEQNLHRTLPGLLGKDPTLWIVRPKWKKSASQKWVRIVPSRGDTKRWHEVPAGQACRAVLGNILAGPKGDSYLNLSPKTVVKLRSGNFTPLTRKRLFGILGRAKTSTKTMRSIEKVIGTYIASLAIEYSDEPGSMAYHAFMAASRWAVIDHIVRDLKEEGDKLSVGRIRRSMAPFIDELDYAGVPKALMSALKYIKNDPALFQRFQVTSALVLKTMETFVVDIFYKISAPMQRVLSLEGRHRVAEATRDKLIGGGTSKALLGKTDTHTKALPLPEFNTKKRREWLANREGSHASLYMAMRQAATMPEDARAGACGFRVGGAGTGFRSPPPLAADGTGVTMFLSPLMALADAARRGDASPILWAARFPIKGRVLRSGTVSGTPKSGFVHIDLSEALKGQSYGISNYLRSAALCAASDEGKLAQITAMFYSYSNNPTMRDRVREALRTMVKEELGREQAQVTRKYLSFVYEATDSNLVHSAFWPLSILIKHTSSLGQDQLDELSMGSELKQRLEASSTIKQKRWTMYSWIDTLFTTSLYGFALVEVAKLRSGQGVIQETYIR